MSQSSTIQELKFGIVIASKGRPNVLAETLLMLGKQTKQPEQLVIVVTGPEDIPQQLPSTVIVVIGPTGSTFQRNYATPYLKSSIDYIVFFDDDIELHETYLERAALLLCKQPDLIAFSGLMLSDGKIDRSKARFRLENFTILKSSLTRVRTTGSHHTLHGCNMVIKRAAFEQVRFNENLPLYAYGEDYEISIRLKNFGRVGRFNGCIGIHLQDPLGRVCEKRRGYAQIANPWYFLCNDIRHIPLPFAVLRFWTICVGKNLTFCAWNYLTGNTQVNWSRRAQGYLLALKDISYGKCDPKNILTL